MKLDPNKYRRPLDAIKDQIKRDGFEKLADFSVATHIPLLAVVLYAMRAEVLGPSTELSAMAASLVEFYGYTEVKEWEEA